MSQKISSSTTILFAVAFCTISSKQMAVSIISVYAKEYLQASTVQVGMIVSMFFITGVLCRVPVGICLRGSRTPYLFILAILICSISPLLYLIAPNPFSLMLVRVIHAIGFAFYVPTAIGLVSLLTPQSGRALALSRYGIAGGSGLMAGPAIGALGTRLFGLKNVFYLASLDAVIGLVLVVGVLLPKLRRAVGDEASPQFHMNEIPKILSNRAVDVSYLAYFSTSFLYGTNLAFTPIYCRENFHLSEEFVAGLFSGYFLFAAAVRVLLSGLIERVNTYKLLLVALLNGAIMGLIMFQTETSVLLFLLAFFLTGISHGLVFPLGAILIAHTVKPSQLFLTNSMYLFGYDLGGGIGPLLMAYFVTRWGIPPAFALSALLPMGSSVITYRLRAQLRY